MGVSKNRGGPPKSSILIGFGTIKNHPFIFGNNHICGVNIFHQSSNIHQSYFGLVETWGHERQASACAAPRKLLGGVKHQKCWEVDVHPLKSNIDTQNDAIDT